MIAASPRAVGAGTPEQRRRWVVAAATAGLVLSSQGALRTSETSAVPADVRAAVQADPSLAPYLLPEHTPSYAASPGAGEVASPLGVGNDLPRAAGPAPHEEVADLGALPDGPIELATAGDVAIVAEGSRVELVGFHESSSGSAIDMQPAAHDGTVHEDAIIDLPTRHRAGSPTSAIDVAVAPGADVIAPVTGEVVAVSTYALYGSTEDVVVEIRPDADPSITVSITHVVDPSVAAGDRVEAGVTAIAAEGRQLPFDSQIDRFTTAHRGQAAPHLHIEMRRG